VWGRGQTQRREAVFALVRELARGLEPLTCCFSAGRVEALWQGAVVWRLALSDLAWTPIVFDHLAIAEPESVGQSVGREWGPDCLRVSDIQACDDCFGVGAGRPMGSVHRQTANGTAASSCGRATALRLLAVLLSANRDGTQRPLGPELCAGAALSAMNAGGQSWSCFTWLRYDVLGPIAARAVSRTVVERRHPARPRL
jgi:hypothetical protein